MSKVLRWQIISILAGLVILVGCDQQEDAVYQAEIDSWHAERIERLRSETGWLTLVGLHPLGQGVNILGSGPDSDVVLAAVAPATLGTLTLTGGQADLRPAPGIQLVSFVEGAEAGEFGGGAVKTDGQGGPDQIAVGSLVFYVIQRGEKYFLRVKDRQSPVLQKFQGVERYPVNKAWRVTARLEGEPGTVSVANVLGQVAAEPTPGLLVFELDGAIHRLRPTGEPGAGMFVVFGDATNGHGTYPGGRFLSTDPPDENGNVVLDFNRAYNPPCVFSEYATCPLPGLDNMLLVPITAGEKTWGTGH
jgi:uncharacterized protein (DUF1684 family)